MPLNISTIITEIAQKAAEVFSLTWWFIVPAFLFFLFIDLWKTYIRRYYFKNLKWIILEVRTPSELLKDPKSMEQIFSAVHGTYSFGIKFMEKYWHGKLEDWHSFDIVGDVGGVRFLIRTRDVYRNLVESAVYSQYPEAEIKVVDDYTKSLPSILPNDVYDIFGTDFILTKENAYPIKTYPAFEVKEKEERIDTIASIAEVMSNLKEGERIWLQLLVRPIGDNWKKDSEVVINKLAGRKESKKISAAEQLVEFFKNLIIAPFRSPEWSEEIKPEKPTLVGLTEGEKNTIKAIENKASKLGFEGILRFVYIDEKERFSRSNISAVIGALKQFNTLDLNGLRPNIPTMTVTTGALKNVLKSYRVYIKKRLIYFNYRNRIMTRKFSIFNTEELATMYHFPTIVVAAPGLQPIEFKKGAPPSNLPL